MSNTTKHNGRVLLARAPADTQAALRTEEVVAYLRQ